MYQIFLKKHNKTILNHHNETNHTSIKLHFEHIDDWEFKVHKTVLSTAEINQRNTDSNLTCYCNTQVTFVCYVNQHKESHIGSHEKTSLYFSYLFVSYLCTFCVWLGMFMQLICCHSPKHFP